MNETFNQKTEEIEIDLLKLAKVVFRKVWLVAGASLVGAVLAFAVTFLFIKPQYESSVMFYVNNNSVSLGDATLSITSADISASRGLVDSYIVILKARETLIDVIDYAEVDRTYLEVGEMLSAEAVNNTEIFQAVVTSPNPQEAEKIANAIAYILPKRIASIIEGTSAKIVDSAIIAPRPSSPSYTGNALIGFLIGFVLSTGMIVLGTFLDTMIRTEEDITQCCKYPVLAVVPDMTAPMKGGYGGSFDKKRVVSAERKPGLMGNEVGFAAAEAYKLLRTKLQFSFADENQSHVIGVSSALNGEGKSLLSINLAYSLSQLGKKVILIDCDLRRPTVAEKLKIRKKPGLSDFLTGQCSLEKLFQHCGIEQDEGAFYVIAAGPNPPNPIELLSSQRMAKTLAGIRKICDYVILDLPPMGEVSDALAVARETDGILLVVRENQCNRIALADTLRQFEFVDTKILGVVFNGATDSVGKFGYKKYYKNDYQSSKLGTEGNDPQFRYGREKKKGKK